MMLCGKAGLTLFFIACKV